VSAAYDQLVAEGYLTARRGAGTAVADLAHPRADTPDPARDVAVPRFDLRPGRPDVTTFPAAAWLRATRRALAAAPAAVYGYGDPGGRVELRSALAEYLGRTRGVVATAEQIVVTSGYVQALALLTRVLGDAGTTRVAMEDPGFVFHREVVRRSGPAVVALPVDERGARTDMLSTAGFPAVGAVVVTPAHQYPTGVTLHPSRRQALTDWARSGGGLIVEDDYDGEFRYDRQPVGALQGVAPDHIAYLGTASKTLGPALRLGWMVLPPHLVDPVLDAKRYTDHHTETIGQLALADLVTTHAYDRHIRRCRLRYRRRRDLLLARLGHGSGRAPAGFAVHGIAAGLHALVSLPAGGPGERDVLAGAAARDLAVGVLGNHWHYAGDHPQGVIIGYGTPADRAYPAAVDTLMRILQSLGVHV
jgi:GntR family transcriptional regulator/MocR family aminotransferase